MEYGKPHAVNGHKLVPSQCQPLHGLPSTLNPESLQHLVEILDTASVCAGHDNKFVQMMRAKKGKKLLTVTMNIQHCPPGFQQSMNDPVCICAERLQQYTKTCLVDRTTVLREHNAQFWVGYDSDN